MWVLEDTYCTLILCACVYVFSTYVQVHKCIVREGYFTTYGIEAVPASDISFMFVYL